MNDDYAIIKEQPGFWAAIAVTLTAVDHCWPRDLVCSNNSHQHWLSDGIDFETGSIGVKCGIGRQLGRAEALKSGRPLPATSNSPPANRQWHNQGGS